MTVTEREEGNQYLPHAHIGCPKFQVSYLKMREKNQSRFSIQCQREKTRTHNSRRWS